jgi:hypothetical protein
LPEGVAEIAGHAIARKGRPSFLKKEAKKFAPAPSQPDVLLVQLARSQTDKGFLLLFFKKEALSFLPGKATHHIRRVDVSLGGPYGRL